MRSRRTNCTATPRSLQSAPEKRGEICLWQMRRARARACGSEPISAALSPMSPRSTKRPASCSSARPVHAAPSGRGHPRRRRQGRRRLSKRRAFPARHDHRDQHAAGAHRRPDRAADHPRLPRYLRDRPHQPARFLQSLLREARAAGRALAALRGRRADAGRRLGPCRRSTRSRSCHSRASSRRAASRRSRSCCCIPIATRRMSSGRRRSCERNHPADVRLVQRTTVAGISRVRARLDSRRQCLYRPARRSLSRRARPAFARRSASAASSLSCNRPAASSRPTRRGAMRAHAGIGPGRRRHRRAGDLPHARPARSPSLSIWAAPRQRRASSSRARPLTTGAALIGGYERALPIQIPMMDIFEVGTGGGSIARVEEGSCASARKAPARCRARPAMAAAGPSRP